MSKTKEPDAHPELIVSFSIFEPNATTVEALKELERGEGVFFWHY